MRSPPALLLGFVLGLFGLAACGDGDRGSGSGPEAEPLRVGLEAKYPPFESMDEKGELRGFDVDLARALGEHLGRPVVFRDLAWEALIPELQQGRLDLVCSGVSLVPERAEQVDFSEPYAQVPMGVLVSTKTASFVRTIDDLDTANVTVAVQRKTSGALKAKARLPKATILEYDTEVDAAMNVANGSAHAFVYDMVSITKLAKQYPDRTRILDADLGVELYCMMLPKGSPLLRQVNHFVAQASAPGGTIETLMRTWDLDPNRFLVRNE